MEVGVSFATRRETILSRLLDCQPLLSDHQCIDDQQRSVLSKGLNFAPTPNRIPVARIIANVETALKFSKASSTSVSNARSRIIGILNREPRLAPNLSPSERLALKQLKTNEDIIILLADKGRATVVMDRKDYDGKLLTMLSDTTVYKWLKRDPTSSLERQMNSKLLELRRKDQFPERLYQRLRSSSGQTPRIYGLPKIHKPDIPLVWRCRPLCIRGSGLESPASFTRTCCKYIAAQSDCSFQKAWT